MEVRAQHRNARMAPRKLRHYRELLKGLPTKEATAQLTFMPGQASALLLKVLRSAVANAAANLDISEDKLTVRDIIIDGGFTMKRFRPVSKGMAHPILKRTSHITVVVEELSGGTEQVKRKKRKTEIQEFTADDVASGKVGGREVEHVEGEKDEKKPATNTPHPSKQEEAYQKMKMQQQGGDPKKSHRRKSLGE